MNNKVTPELLREKMAIHLRAEAGKAADRGTLWDYWMALSHTVVELIADDWKRPEILMIQLGRHTIFQPSFWKADPC